MTSLNRRELWQFMLVLLLAAAIRFYNLGYASLWLDEAETIRISSYPFSRLWVTAYDNTPPLYYTVIHFLLKLGHGEYLLRLPSAVFGVLSIAIMYLATRKISGSTAALITALILSLSFHNIEYSQEARAYSLLGLSLSVSILGLAMLSVRWNESCSGFTFFEFIRSGGGLYALGLIAALYTHNVAVFYWLGVQVFFFAWWVRPFRFSPSCLVSWTAINLVVLVLWMPWLNVSLQLIQRGTFSWLKQADPDTAFAIWRAIHGFRAVEFGQPYIDLLLAIAALAGIYSLRRNIAVGVLFFSLLITSSLATWAYGFVGTPVFMPRTILWGSLISAALVGIGISSLPRVIGAGMLLIFLAAGAKGVYEYFNTNFAENEHWRSAVAVFDVHQKPNDILLFREDYMSMPFFYYVNKESPGWDIYSWSCRNEYARTGTIREVNSVKIIKWKTSDLGPGNPVPVKAGASLWVIESHCHPENQAAADAVFLPNWRLQETYDFDEILLRRLVPSIQ